MHRLIKAVAYGLGIIIDSSQEANPSNFIDLNIPKFGMLYRKKADAIRTTYIKNIKCLQALSKYLIPKSSDEIPYRYIQSQRNSIMPVFALQLSEISIQI